MASVKIESVGVEDWKVVADLNPGSGGVSVGNRLMGEDGEWWQVVGQIACPWPGSGDSIGRYVLGGARQPANGVVLRVVI